MAYTQNIAVDIFFLLRQNFLCYLRYPGKLGHAEELDAANPDPLEVPRVRNVRERVRIQQHEIGSLPDLDDAAIG